MDYEEKNRLRNQLEMSVKTNETAPRVLRDNQLRFIYSLRFLIKSQEYFFFTCTHTHALTHVGTGTHRSGKS